MIWHAPEIVTRGSGLPIPVQVARDWLNEDAANDGLLAGVLRAAALHTEARTSLFLTPVTVRLRASGFPAGRSFELPRGPLTTLTAIKYRDTAGAEQTFSAARYRTVATGSWQMIELLPDYDWPETDASFAPVTVEAALGFADWNALPADLQVAVQYLLAHWWRTREAVVTGTITAEVPLGYESMVAVHRKWGIG